jgi:integrase
MPPSSSQLSVIHHSSTESLLCSGVDPSNTISQVCARHIIVSDIQAFALAPSTRESLEQNATALNHLASLHHLHPLHDNVLRAYFQSLLDKGWKMSSVLCRVSNTAMMAHRLFHENLQARTWFADLSQGLERLALLDQPKQAVPLTLQQLHSLLTDLLNDQQLEIAAAIALARFTAGRLGEVLKIPRQHRHNDSPMSLKLSISKGVFGSQEKTIPPGPLSDIVRRWAMTSSSPIASGHVSRLFNCTRPQVIAALRRVSPALSGHSLRRGALTHADRIGVDSEDIQVMSGHRSTTMLQRYIGRACSSRRKAMVRTGTALQQRL